MLRSRMGESEWKRFITESVDLSERRIQLIEELEEQDDEEKKNN